MRKPRPRQHPMLSKPEWAKRRLRLDLALTAIGIWVTYIIFFGMDTGVHQQSIIALIAGGVALIGQYVFGAAWDDNNYMKAVKEIEINRGPSDEEEIVPPVDEEAKG